MPASALSERTASVRSPLISLELRQENVSVGVAACPSRRHTAATLLLAQGVPARVLMEVLGHSQIGVTMNIYSHVMPTQLVQAANAMEKALWGEDG